MTRSSISLKGNLGTSHKYLELFAFTVHLGSRHECFSYIVSLHYHNVDRGKWGGKSGEIVPSLLPFTGTGSKIHVQVPFRRLIRFPLVVDSATHPTERRQFESNFIHRLLGTGQQFDAAQWSVNIDVSSQLLVQNIVMLWVHEHALSAVHGMDMSVLIVVCAFWGSTIETTLMLYAKAVRQNVWNSCAEVIPLGYVLLTDNKHSLHCCWAILETAFHRLHNGAFDFGGNFDHRVMVIPSLKCN